MAQVQGRVYVGAHFKEGLPPRAELETGDNGGEWL